MSFLSSKPSKDFPVLDREHNPHHGLQAPVLWTPLHLQPPLSLQLSTMALVHLSWPSAAGITELCSLFPLPGPPARQTAMRSLHYSVQASARSILDQRGLFLSAMSTVASNYPQSLSSSLPCLTGPHCTFHPWHAICVCRFSVCVRKNVRVYVTMTCLVHYCIPITQNSVWCFGSKCLINSVKGMNNMTIRYETKNRTLPFLQRILKQNICVFFDHGKCTVIIVYLPLSVKLPPCKRKQ